MKKLLMVLGLMGMGISLFTQEPMSYKERLLTKYSKGKVFAMKQWESLPAFKMVPLSKMYRKIIFELDGNHKPGKLVLGMNSANERIIPVTSPGFRYVYLDIVDSEIKGNELQIKTMMTTYAYGILLNEWIFKMKPKTVLISDDEIFQDVDQRVLGFFHLFNSMDDPECVKFELPQPKELTLGLTIDQVREILGEEPKTKVTMGDKMMCKYRDGTVLTFQDGKLVDIKL